MRKMIIRTKHQYYGTNICDLIHKVKGMMKFVNVLTVKNIYKYWRGINHVILFFL